MPVPLVGFARLEGTWPPGGGHHHQEQGAVFQVFGVNYDGLQGDDLAGVMERMQIEFPVMVDDPRVALGVPRAAVLPMTVVINPQGEVQKVLSGPQTAHSILASR